MAHVSVMHVQGQPQREIQTTALAPQTLSKSQKAVHALVQQELASRFERREPSPTIHFPRDISTIPPLNPKTRQKLSETKNKERKALYRAYHEASKATRLPPSPSPLSKKALSQEALARAILRQVKAKGLPISEEDKEDAETLAHMLLSFDSLDLVKGDTIGKWELDSRVISVHAKKSRTSASLSDKQFNNDYKKLHDITKKLQAALQDPSPKNPAKANKKALLLLRKALSTSAYSLLCHDESIPEIRFLHQLVMASFVDINPLDHFENLGDHISEHGQINTDSISSKEGFSQTLRTFREKGQQQRLMASDHTAAYVLSAWGQTIGAFRSVGAPGKYDPRALENIGGRLFREDLAVGDGRRTVPLTAIYSHSPTIGNKVSLETKAFLQAMENRCFMTPEELKKEPDFAKNTHWTYTNLQNTLNRHEAPRSRAIMALNQEFPFSFTGITITQDSPFFTDGIKGHMQQERRAQQAIRGRAVPLNKAYALRMHEEIISENGGYSFPPDPNWEEVSLEIVRKALTMTESFSIKDPQTPEDCLHNSKVKTAFRELVNLGLIRYWQMNSLPEQGQGLVSTCCKECIDRGGKMMSEFLWALGDNTPDTLKHVIYSAHSRALLARKRLILPHRLEPFLHLSEVVDQREVKNFLTEQIIPLADTTIKSSGAMPSVSSSV